MSIAERLTEDMKTSMKAGDSERTGVLRLLRGSIKNDEIKLGHDLSDDEALKVLAREAKQRRDSIEAYNKADRKDLADHEEAELLVISEYLPVALSEAELSTMVDDVIAEMGASDTKQLGAVIGAVMKKCGSAADGGVVSRLVREKLGA
ncbi:MAG TPA: GatB/YqeY domain-containing protein [Candidatus Saccharimonadia bacterium]|nr:GatB/YqeY domain-containing protein [Candidatus Saccharimonadia bacterium]